MLGPIFHDSTGLPGRHVHCNRSYCLETLCLRSKPKFEVKKCLAATYVMAAGSIGLKKIRHLRNLSYSKNIVMAHTWTVPDTSSLNRLGFVICRNPWSPWSVARYSGIDCSQIRYTSCRIVSSTLACLAWYSCCMALKVSSTIFLLLLPNTSFYYLHQYPGANSVVFFCNSEHNCPSSVFFWSPCSTHSKI